MCEEIGPGVEESLRKHLKNPSAGKMTAQTCFWLAGKVHVHQARAGGILILYFALKLEAGLNANLPGGVDRGIQTQLNSGIQ